MKKRVLHPTWDSLRVVFFLLLGVFATGTAFASTIRISNPKIELELAPGETYSGEIAVENPDSDEVKTKIYLEDWNYAPGGTGEKKFFPAGTTALSASRWITFSPSAEVLKPFGRIVERYTVTVPQDAKGGYTSVLFFESILGTAPTEEEGVNVLVAGRIGALFFIHVKGTEKRTGEIQKLEIVPPEGNKPLEIRTTLADTGNIDLAVGGNFLIMDTEGKVLGRGDLAKLYTLPGDIAESKTQWVGRLPKGNYSLLLTYDLGQGQSLVREESLNVA